LEVPSGADGDTPSLMCEQAAVCVRVCVCVPTVVVVVIIVLVASVDTCLM